MMAKTIDWRHLNGKQRGNTNTEAEMVYWIDLEEPLGLGSGEPHH